jgi:hypothetical protein
MPLANSPELQKLLEEAVKEFAKLSPEQQEEIYRKQREGYVRAEMSWPKAKYKWVNGVKVYDSMEDYYND